MAWIESHQSLRDHRKTKRMARRLGIPRIYVVGHLHGVWWWALDNAPTGFVADDDLLSIAEAAEWDGDGNEFVETLIYSEFAERTEGGVIIHDWEEYAGKLLEQRQANAERQRRFREKRRNADPAHDNEDSNALRNAHVTVTNTVTSPSRNAATGPNRTGPNHTSTNVDAPVEQTTVEEKNAAHAAPLDAAVPSSLREQRTAILDQLLYTKGNRERIGLLQRAVGLSLGEETDIQPGLLAKLAKEMGAGELCKLIFSCGLKYEGIDSAASYLSAAAAKHHTDLKATRNGHAPPEPQYRPADTEEERAEKIRKELEWAAEHTIPPSYMRTRTNGASSHRASATSRGEFSPRSEDT